MIEKLGLRVVVLSSSLVAGLALSACQNPKQDQALLEIRAELRRMQEDRVARQDELVQERQRAEADKARLAQELEARRERAAQELNEERQRMERQLAVERQRIEEQAAIGQERFARQLAELEERLALERRQGQEQAELRSRAFEQKLVDLRRQGQEQAEARSREFEERLVAERRQAELAVAAERSRAEQQQRSDPVLGRVLGTLAETLAELRRHLDAQQERLDALEKILQDEERGRSLRREGEDGVRTTLQELGQGVAALGAGLEQQTRGSKAAMAALDALRDRVTGLETRLVEGLRAVAEAPAADPRVDALGAALEQEAGRSAQALEGLEVLRGDLAGLGARVDALDSGQKRLAEQARLEHGELGTRLDAIGQLNDQGTRELGRKLDALTLSVVPPARTEPSSARSEPLQGTTEPLPGAGKAPRADEQDPGKHLDSMPRHDPVPSATGPGSGRDASVDPETLIGTNRSFWQSPWFAIPVVTLLLIGLWTLLRRETVTDDEGDVGDVSGATGAAPAPGSHVPEPGPARPASGSPDPVALTAADRRAEPVVRIPRPEPAVADPRGRLAVRSEPGTVNGDGPGPELRPSCHSLRVSADELRDGAEEAVRSLLLSDPRVLVEPRPRLERRADGALSIRYYSVGGLADGEVEEIGRRCRSLATETA